MELPLSDALRSKTYKVFILLLNYRSKWSTQLDSNQRHIPELQSGVLSHLTMGAKKRFILRL